MAIRGRRLAGTALAGHQLEDVSQQLNEARARLRQRLVEQRPEVLGADAEYVYTPTEAPSFNEAIQVGGHQVGLHASPRSLDANAVSDIGPIPARQMGDRQTYDLLAANPPSVEYSMSWDVDGGYQDRSLSPRETIAISRAAQRGWDDIIGKMPEGALVSNSPVGAAQGDFKRADIYMSSGFGPVQTDGMQYGLVQGGKIIPLSPLAANEEHAKHLAKRARMAGAGKLSDDVLTALSDPTREKLLSYSPEGGVLAGTAKGGDRGIADYDDYDNGDYDDYPDPVRPEDVKRNVENSIADSDQSYRTTGIPEVDVRRIVEEEIGYAGINRGPEQRGVGGYGTGEQRGSSEPNYDYELRPDEIQQVRDFQAANIGNPSGDHQRGLIDAFNALYPRRAPQQITAEDLEAGRNRWRMLQEMPPRNAEQLAAIDPTRRHDVAVEMVRQALDSTGPFYLGGMENNVASAKQAMTDIDLDLSGITGNQIVRELYTPQDVALAREVQTRMAARGGKEGTRRRRGARRRPSQFDQEPQTSDLTSGVTQHIGPLSPQQEAAIAAQLNAESGAASANDSLDTIQSWFNSTGRGGQMYRQEYGNDMSELTAGSRVNPRMSDRAVQRILDGAATQPGRFSRREVGDAVLTLQARGSSASASDPVANIQSILDGAARGPAAPIRRNRMDRDQMSIEVPGVGTLNRPNPYVSEAERDAYQSAPEGMSMNEFRQWRSGGSGLEGAQRDMADAWSAPPLFPEFGDDIPRPSEVDENVIVF